MQSECSRERGEGACHAGFDPQDTPRLGSIRTFALESDDAHGAVTTDPESNRGLLATEQEQCRFVGEGRQELARRRPGHVGKLPGLGPGVAPARRAGSFPR